MTKTLSNPKLFAVVALVFSIATFANLMQGAPAPQDPAMYLVVPTISGELRLGPSIPPAPEDPPSWEEYAQLGPSIPPAPEDPPMVDEGVDEYQLGPSIPPEPETRTPPVV
jgi:hypothetical protein